MPSAIWTGSISFGLVQVPVRLVSATKSHDVSFNQLEEGTGARIRYRRVSEQSGDEVPNDKIVKGYEISKGQYVVVEPAELEAIQPKSAHTIEIEQFIDLADIDPIYFDQPYYLSPDARGTKPYRLLLEAMEELGKVAIGRVVIRSKERLVAIRPLDGVLCIETMRFADEVLPRDELVPDDVELTDRERTMAHQLVESLTEPFEPERFHDEYRDQLMELIEKKAAGEEIVTQPEPEAPAKVLDLVAALEASLERGGQGGAEVATDEDEATSAKRSRRKKAAG